MKVLRISNKAVNSQHLAQQISRFNVKLVARLLATTIKLPKNHTQADGNTAAVQQCKVNLARLPAATDVLSKLRQKHEV